jgi:3-oxoacyl-[acyl-carrier-protein] synthase III
MRLSGPTMQFIEDFLHTPFSAEAQDAAKALRTAVSDGADPDRAVEAALDALRAANPQASDLDLTIPLTSAL